MKKALKGICCYARFGNSSQLEMEQRETELRHYADTHNLEIEKIEFEQLSGLKQSALLNQLIENESIKAILTPTISCLTRDIKLLFGIKAKAAKYNTQIISIDGSC